MAETLKDRLEQQFAGMRHARLSWWSHWRELADYILPRRYVWLLSENEARSPQHRNRYILDSTGTMAARTLASGMMNGITSPARPWFRLRIAGFDDETGPVRLWLDDTQERMRIVMAESNFYNAMAVLYLDLVTFGTPAMTIYEDYQDVIRCYTHAIGEFYVEHDERFQVTRFAREITYKVHQLVAEFGIENVSDHVRNAYNAQDNQLYQGIKIRHFVEPNKPPIPELRGNFAFREFYWEMGNPVPDKFLRISGFREFPTIVPRWEITGNESYGSCPAMDALPDIIQLQHETKKKAQALDKLVDPPIVADVQLSNQPTSLLPGGITYIAGVNNAGVKPIYTIDGLPLAELTNDIISLQQRIRQTFHNDLFRMISELETVRSATEIDARREEKLVLLGPVLDRFESEALDPAISRIYRIMERKNLLLPHPPELENQEIEVQYVSVLSDAQRAVATIPIERFAQFTGNLGAIQPDVLDVPNWEEMTREYGRSLGVATKVINSRDRAAELRKGREEVVAAQQSANIGEVLTKSAKQLSETEVGGGANALQTLIGS